MRLRHAVALATFLSLASCQSGEDDDFTQQDENTIRAISDSALAYVRAGNWPAWVDLYTDDAVIHPPNGPAVRGRAAIQAWTQQLPRFEQITIVDLSIAGGEELAYLHGDFVARVAGAVAPDTSKQLVIFRRTNGAWKAVALSFSPTAPQPGPAPSQPTPASRPAR